jgi:hypothetical protein
MPNGMKLTMLAVECCLYKANTDRAFRTLLKTLEERLKDNLEVENLADTNTPKAKLTKTKEDPNMVELRDKVEESLGKLSVLDKEDCTKADARNAWEWVFKTDGFFKEHDDEQEKGSSTSNASKGLTAAVPTRAVDPRGGSRFG